MTTPAELRPLLLSPEEAAELDAPGTKDAAVLVPLYLHHRYAVEGAASALGGQNYIYALRGDGRNPVSWTPAAAQKAALDALLVTIKPSELALSRAVLSKLPPRPPGYGRTRELFPRYTGGAFDPLTPAMVASDLTIGFMLTNDRAARMVDQWEREISSPLMNGPLNIAQITLACGLGTEARNADFRWRDGHPKLTAWFERMAARPSFAATAAPKG